MKFRYFLRGLGIGIIFASLVFLVVFQNSVPDEMTDEEIIEKAKELGMVEEEDPLDGLLTSQTDTDSEEQKENGSEGVSETTTEISTEDISSTEQKATTEAAAEATTEAAAAKEAETVTITVDRGSSSYPVCQKLQEAGLIEDASEFDAYLIQNGYASRIRVGEHTLKRGMSYHDIAEAISDPA